MNDYIKNIIEKVKDKKEIKKFLTNNFPVSIILSNKIINAKKEKKVFNKSQREWGW